MKTIFFVVFVLIIGWINNSCAFRKMTESNFGSAEAGVELLSNIQEARRLELKQNILGNMKKENSEVKENEVRELVGYEIEGDLLALLVAIAENDDIISVKKLEKYILDYSNPKYASNVLIKAGYSKNKQVNFIAANMLLKQDEDLAALKIMVALIKKGECTPQVVNILESAIAKNTKYIVRSELWQIESNESLPDKIRVFSLVILTVYYNTYFDYRNAEWLVTTLKKTDVAFNIFVLDLMAKKLNYYTEYYDAKIEVIKELSTSEIPEVAKKAKEYHQKLKEENLQVWKQGVLGSKKKNKYSSRKEHIVRFLHNAGDSEENVRFLIKVLKGVKESEDIKIAIIKALKTSQYFELVLPELRKLVSETNERGVKSSFKEVMRWRKKIQGSREEYEKKSSQK